MSDMTLEPGEWIVSGRSSDKYAGELAAINAGLTPAPGFRIERCGNLFVYVPIKPVTP